MQMGIMFCLSATMYGDVIGNSDTSRALFEELVHLLLEDVQWADQTKGKTQEMVPPKGAVKGTLNSAYNEVAFNKKLAITKENLRTKYTYSHISTLSLTKSCL